MSVPTLGLVLNQAQDLAGGRHGARNGLCSGLSGEARPLQHKGDKDAAIELAVVKTVAGFMNARGGTLVIGVNDQGEAVGIEADYRTINRGDRDRWENWLTTLLEVNLGKPAVADVGVAFDRLDGHDVCRVEVAPSRRPVYVTAGKNADLYVRLNNSTRLLNTAEAVDYIASHWR